MRLFRLLMAKAHRGIYIASIIAPSVNEGDNLVFTVTLNTATTSDTNFAFTFANANGLGFADITGGSFDAVTFSNGVTKTAGASGTLTVPSGVSSFTTTFGTVDDALYELNERISVTIGGVNAQGTILDNDTIPTISINSVTQNEETSSMVFTVTQSAITGRATTFNYATSDGTATAGIDYTAVSGTGTINIGATTTTITVPILDDVLVEGSETLFVTISSASGATIATAIGTGTITNTDTAINNVSGSSASFASQTGWIV